MVNLDRSKLLGFKLGNASNAAKVGGKLGAKPAMLASKVGLKPTRGQA